MSAPPPIDARAAALARLQASRERLVQEMRPGQHGRPWRSLRWLEHPWRLLRRWWHHQRPAVAAGEWLQSSSGSATALHEAGDLAFTRGRRWVRRHPLTGVALAAVLGALLIRKREVFWGLALGVGQGILLQGRQVLLRWVSDPALCGALLAVLMAKEKTPPSDRDEG